MINFDSTKEEMELITKITKRAVAVFPEMDYMSLSMDITATHLNGCELKLAEFLNSGDSDFNHDICGIYSNLNRGTGMLNNCFLPRFSA